MRPTFFGRARGRGVPFDQGERMFAAVCIDPERGDQHQIVADVQAVDLDHQ